MTTLLLKVNQDDKPLIISNILKFYKKSWEDYDRDMLREQIKDIKCSLTEEEQDELTKEQLINILMNEDARCLSEKSYFELQNEISDYDKISY
jgi:PHD/YefM family antitoxin component YafN of YafNO toxin-antitoxin module